MTPNKSPQVIEIPLANVMDTGAPEPHILAESGHVNIMYRTLKDGKAKLEFNGCIHFSFGAPNDETLHGHPLWEAGLRSYRLFEVFNSPLITQLKQINSVHDRHEESRFDNYRHLILTFHDNMFECVCRTFIESVDQP